MNAVQYGLSKIHLTIPNEVLVLAFRDPDPTRDQLVSLDDKIMTNFIRPHVMQDMNVVGGIPINVDLSLVSSLQIKHLSFSIYDPHVGQIDKFVLMFFKLLIRLSILV